MLILPTLDKMHWEDNITDATDTETLEFKNIWENQVPIAIIFDNKHADENHVNMKIDRKASKRRFGMMTSKNEWKTRTYVIVCMRRNTDGGGVSWKSGLDESGSFAVDKWVEISEFGLRTKLMTWGFLFTNCSIYRPLNVYR